jgi:hypothetical protein
MTVTATCRTGSQDQDRSPEYDRPALPPILAAIVALSGCASTILSLAALC